MTLNLETESCDFITSSGRKIWFQDPYGSEIDLCDILEASSNICRYNGHLKWPLLKHHVLSFALCLFDLQTQMIDPLACAAVLAHDFHEAYIGDIISPLKKHIPEYSLLEIRWNLRVLDFLLGSALEAKGITIYNWYSGDVSHFICKYDTLALLTETKYLQYSGLSKIWNRYSEYQNLMRPEFDEIVSIIDSLDMASLKINILQDSSYLISRNEDNPFNIYDLKIWQEIKKQLQK